MNIKIVAVGSTRLDRFLKKWGISYLIDDDLLFDTFGNPDIFIQNLTSLNTNLSKINHIIISHNHWDHISGLWQIIYKFKNLNVYVCSNFENDVKEKIKNYGANLIEVKGILKIKDGVYTTGEIKGSYKDNVIFEQSLVIETEKGLIVLTGCSHPGIINILKKVKENFPDKNIFSVIGGFHLLNKKSSEIEYIVDEFKRMGIKKVGPTHCSGRLAEEIFKKRYGEDFIKIKSKQTIEI
jgi:7,8-dihydropterin-6-yl-methyl-4-(beta-D-ribofuranosyl)aminobenzene 5'-phosphate synthase